MPKGNDFTATINEVGKDAHWDKNPQSYDIRKIQVNCNSYLKINLAASGGVAISIR